MRTSCLPTFKSALLTTAVSAALLAGGSPVRAQDAELAARVARLEALVARQQTQIEAQDAEIAQARAAEGERWRVRTDAELQADTARGLAPTDFADVRRIQTGPQTPVAAPPQLSAQRSQLAAIPEGMAVLSRQGRASVDLSADYTRSSANRLVFRGIEIVPGIQIGVIEANEADRDTVSTNVAARYGLTSRLEVETRIPFIKRSDTITTVQQRDEAVTRTIDLDGKGVGDIEAAIRYQLNTGEGGRPIFIGALRVKSDTGEGPFEIDRDEFGIATRLATGSGFWGVEPSISMLFASDPAVIFANLGYFAHLPRDIDEMQGGVLIGEVDPGDSIGAALGFGFALNQKFSYSLGYRHNYILPTTSELNGTSQKSDDLQVGALLFGLSYRFDDKYSLNGNFEFGVTEDAPDMRFILRLPFTF